MTRVTKLEMKGFKSFAKQTDIVFGDNFNVILGPNGSGKSNVIDALTFVLGKSSAKSLRAEKSANLIYNGGKTKTPAKEGFVSIYFSNDSEEFPLKTKEVKVTRLVKSSGQSQYFINDKKHTRNEVIDLLHYAKINPDGYNIILQGDIVRFVEQSGNERRIIIEQIADISVYEEKKSKAFKELEKVEASMKEAQIILKERQTYLKELSQEREQAQKYTEHENRVKKSKATLLHVQIQQKEKAIEDIQKKNSDTVQKHKKLEDELKVLKQEIDTAKKEIQKINSQIEEQGDARQVQLHKHIEELKITIATNKQKKESISEEIDKIQERKKQIAQTKKELESKLKDLQLEVQKGEKSLKNQDSLKAEIVQKILQFKKKHNLEGASDVEKNIDEIDAKIETEQKRIDELRNVQQDMLRTKDRLEIQIRTADEKIQKVVEVSKEHKKELEVLQQKKKEFKSATVDLSKLLTEDSKIASQVGNARSKTHFLQEEIAKLHAKQASIQETLGGSMAVSKILDQKKKIGGIYGTVSSLGTVDSKYAQALEVAAGSKVRAIVVESDAVAQKCISYLKEQKLGVATFLPLNKIVAQSKKSELASIAKTSEHGFAVDLVSYDSKFAKVFSHVFGNTIVVDSITSARKIGIGKARMITLEGDISDTSGVMQGGFRKVKTHGSSFSNKDVTEKLQKFEKELVDSQSVLSRLEKEKVQLEEDISRMRELKAELEGEIIKMEKGLHLDDKDLDVNQKLKSEFEKELANIEKEYRKIQQDISQVNKTLAQLKMDKQKLRDQISELRNPIKLAELNTLEEQKQKCNEESVRLQSEQRHIQNQISNVVEPEFENIQKVVKQQEREASEFLERKQNLIQTIKEDSDKLKIYTEQEKEFYAKFKVAFEKRNSLQKNIDNLETKVVAKEEQLREFERKTNLVSIEIAKIKAELDVLLEEYNEFKDIEIFKSKTVQELKEMIQQSEQKLREIGPVNMKAVNMYDRVLEEYEKLTTKRDILDSEKENVLVMINEIEVRKKDLFLLVYNRLNENFQRIFKTISTKGEAYLELENPEQPFEAGVSVKVKLSGKKFMDIRSLSGGEKTMTALAFIFAIQENDPSSFYIMDEVDAALDKRNAEKLAELINQYSNRAQYIVISHNDGVIASANTLYGVSMDQQAGVSKIVSLKV